MAGDALECRGRRRREIAIGMAGRASVAEHVGAGPVGRRKVDPAICALQPAGWQFMQRGWVSTFPISVKSVRERCTGSPMFWNAEGNLLLRREWPQALRQERRGEQAE